MLHGPTQPSPRVRPQDLNSNTKLPYLDHSFDAVVCAQAVMYLRHPEAVLREARRVLRPAGVLIITFNARNMWRPKAIRGWKERTGLRVPLGSQGSARAAVRERERTVRCARAVREVGHFGPVSPRWPR